MAKTGAKRKSENQGALPTGKSKQRKTTDSRNEEPDSSQGSDHSSDQLFVQEKPAAPKYVKKSGKSRKSEPARPTRNDEYEEDEGRMESYQFLALVEVESKKKKRAARAASEYMDRFKENIEFSSEALKTRLSNHIAVSTTQNTTFLATFRNVYGSSRPLPPPAPGSPNITEELCFVTLFDRSQELVNNALSLITHFTSANEKTENLDVTQVLDNEWEVENETAARVLAIGHNVGVEKYEALLRGVGEMNIDEENEVFVEAVYGAGFENVDGQGKNGFQFGWGKVARKEEKAARKFVRFQRAEVEVP